MSARHNDQATDARRALAAGILTAPVVHLPATRKATADEIDNFAGSETFIEGLFAIYREEMADIAKKAGAPLGYDHKAADAEASDFVTDLREAACEMSAAEGTEDPEPEYDSLTAADYGVGQHRIGGL